jgi:ferredoxin
MEIVYFSPTGNVKYLAQRLFEQLQLKQIAARILPLEHTDPATLKKDGDMVLLYSIHAFHAPRTVIRFARNLPTGHSRRVSIISVGSSKSWANAAASFSIIKILQEKEYSIHRNELLAMPLTIAIAFPDDLAEKLVCQAEEKMDQIAATLLSDQKSISYVPFKSKLMAGLGQMEGLAARFFGMELHASDACSSCGLCERECPEKNIRLNKSTKPEFGLNCLMCLRCIYNCPENAISPRFSKFIPIKGGYTIERYRK